MKRIAKVLVLCACFTAATASALDAGDIERTAAALHGDEGTLAMELSMGGSLPSMINEEMLSPAVLQVVLAFRGQTGMKGTSEPASYTYVAREIADRFAFAGAVAWQGVLYAEPVVRLVGQQAAGARLNAALQAAALRGDCQQIAALMAYAAGSGVQGLCEVRNAAQVALAGGCHEAAALLVAYEAGRRAALN